MGKTMGLRTMSQIGALLRSADGLSRMSLGLNCFSESRLFLVDDMADDRDDIGLGFVNGRLDTADNGLFLFDGLRKNGARGFVAAGATRTNDEDVKVAALATPLDRIEASCSRMMVVVTIRVDADLCF